MVKKLALWLLMLMIIIVVVLYFGMNLIVKTAIEHFGSRLTGTPVTVQSVEFEPFKGKALVTGLMIGNPKGFKTIADAFVRSSRNDYNFIALNQGAFDGITVFGIYRSVEFSFGGN